MFANARTSPVLTDSRYAKAAERASGEERQSITAEIAATADAAAGSAAISTSERGRGGGGGRERALAEGVS